MVKLEFWGLRKLASFEVLENLPVEFKPKFALKILKSYEDKAVKSQNKQSYFTWSEHVHKGHW